VRLTPDGGQDVTCVCAHAGGDELLSGSGDGMVGVWDVRNHGARAISGHEGSVHDVGYWPQALAAAGGGSGRGDDIFSVSVDRTFRVWDGDGAREGAQGAPLAQIGPGATAVLSAAWSSALGAGGGVAVAGGENKSLFGQDFRVGLYSRDPRALEALEASSAPAPGAVHAGQVAGTGVSQAGEAGTDAPSQTGAGAPPTLSAETLSARTDEEIEDMSLGAR
jgi:WD40 repeat protein